MGEKNCSVVLEEIIKTFIENKKAPKDKKMSNEEKKIQCIQYKDAWLEMAGVNGFDIEVINYLAKAKKILNINLLYRYVKEYQINQETCQSILKKLSESKQKEISLFDLSLETLAKCLNDGEASACYLHPLVMFIPVYYNKGDKKKGKESVNKYLLQLLKTDADLTLIDLSVKNAAIRQDFMDLISVCLKDAKEEEFADEALCNYKKINEYLNFNTKENLSEKRQPISNEKAQEIENKNANSVQEVSNLEEWKQLKESLQDLNLELYNRVDIKLSTMGEELKKLKEENSKLEKNNKTLQTKLNEAIMAQEVVNNFLKDERERATRLQKQLEEEKSSKNFYEKENSKLKEYTELKENMLIQKEEKIKSLENHIEKIEGGPFLLPLSDTR